MNTATELLNEVSGILNQRGVDYDKEEERSMEEIVKAFNIIRKQNLSTVDGWTFMQCLKMVRQKSSNDTHRDSFVDGIAYPALAAEAALKTTKTTRSDYDW